MNVLNYFNKLFRLLLRVVRGWIILLLHDVEIIPVSAPHRDHSQVLTDNTEKYFRIGNIFAICCYLRIDARTISAKEKMILM